MSDVLFRPRGAVRVVRPLLLAVATLVTLFPFYAMVVLSLKPAGALTFPRALVPSGITVEAYRVVLGGNDLLRWVVNTLVYSVVSVVLVLLLASMAGYAFAK